MFSAGFFYIKQIKYQIKWVIIMFMVVLTEL